MSASPLAEYLLVGGVAAGVPVLVYLALRRPVAFVAVLVATWIPAIAVTESLALSLHFSGFEVSAPDILAGTMAVTAFIRVLSHGVRGWGRGLALVLLVLLVVHVLRGVSDFGLQTAVNSGRSTLYFIAALAFAATVPGGWDKRVWKIVISAGIALSVVAIPLWLTRGLGSADMMMIHNGELVTSRPIVAPGALVIVQAAILALAIRWPSRRSALYIALAFAGAALLLQHRTVWVIGLAIAIVGFFLWTARAGRRADRVALAAVGLLLLFLPPAAWGLAQSDPLVRSAKEVTHGRSTFTWRQTGWQELIASHDSASTLAVGEPAGTSLNRRIYGTDIDVSAHNGFLETYLRLGIPGVVILVWLGLLLWFGRRQISLSTGLGTHVIGLLLLTQLLFSITFSLDAVQGVIAGVLVAGLAVPGSGRVPAVEPPPMHRLQGSPV